MKNRINISESELLSKIASNNFQRKEILERKDTNNEGNYKKLLPKWIRIQTRVLKQKARKILGEDYLNYFEI